MEDSNIGSHCEHPTCTYKDYLSIFCAKCKKNLCKEHYHSEISCPFNTDIIKDEVIYRDKQNTIMSSILCTFCDEKIYNSQGYDCKTCLLIFCLKHRIESDHKCTKLSKKDQKETYTENKNKFKDKLAALKNKK
jgi:hypothetical protein